MTEVKCQSTLLKGCNTESSSRIFFRCMYSIKMELQEVGCRDMEWMELAQDTDSWRALVNSVMNYQVP